jgi:hypothetical protein
MTTSLYQKVIDSTTFGGRMKYSSSGFGWEWTAKKELPSEHAVYFLLSSFGIEKVGKADGKGGLKQRFSRYLKVNKTLKNDDTDKRWHRTMSSQDMLDQEIQIYYITFPKETKTLKTSLGELEIKFSPASQVEKVLFLTAKSEGNPMRLSGKSA